MKRQRTTGGESSAGAWFFALAFAALAYLQPWQTAEPPKPEPRPIEPATAIFEDVRVELPPDVFAVLKRLIETGRIQHDRIGLDGSQLQRIEFRNGRAVFVPPLRITYDGPGPLNAATTIETIEATADGLLRVDIRNSPIDLVVDQTK